MALSSHDESVKSGYAITFVAPQQEPRGALYPAGKTGYGQLTHLRWLGRAGA